MQVPDATAEYLAEFADIRPYSAGIDDIGSMLQDCGCSKVILDTVSCNLAIRQMCDRLDIHVVEQRSVLLLPKALKNDVEIAGYYACHKRDGAALCAFFCW